MTDRSSQSEVSQPDNEMLYVRELLHRISNEYTNIISFARSVADGSSSVEAKAAANKITQRLHVLAEAHRALCPPSGDEPIDLADNLSGLCRAMTSAWLTPEGIKLQLAVPGPILVRGKICWRACLIVSELIRNASIHASFSDHGCIVVSIDVVSGRVVCQVSDDGEPTISSVPGMGTRLVDALANELQGSVKRRFGKSGARVLLSFPMEPMMLDERAGNGAERKRRRGKLAR
jgi:two-component system, chemotaxis family, sensor kinase Cph1